MQHNEYEKLASQLALCAVKRDTVEITRIKQAAGLQEKLINFIGTPQGKYLLGGLGGAGLGAVVGAMQPKRRGRNALYYGALGGLGGLGLAHLANSGSRNNVSPAQENTQTLPATAETPKTPPPVDVPPPAPVVAPKSTVVPNAVPTALKEVITPVKDSTPPPERFGHAPLDVPLQAGEAAQQLPGMAGVSPAAQSAGGAIGLYAGVRGSRPLTGVFARSADRKNISALASMNEDASRRLGLMTTHNAHALAQAKAVGQKAVADLRASGVTNKAQLQAAYKTVVNAAQTQAAADMAATAAENARRLTSTQSSNAWRSWRGKRIPEVLRILSMLGGTYTGATAPTWMPNAYTAVNDEYNKATGYQGK